MYHCILVVDENTTRLKQIAEGLVAKPIAPGEQFQVITVSSLAAAYLQVFRQRFDLLIVPLNLVCQKIDILKQISDSSPQTKILLLRENKDDFNYDLSMRAGISFAAYNSTPAALRSEVAQLMGFVEPRSLVPPVSRRSVRGVGSEQVKELRGYLSQLGRQAAISFLMLADLSGNDIASWAPIDDVDHQGVAALAAGDMLASVEIGKMLGSQNTCDLIIQEHRDRLILMYRVDDGMILLMATMPDVPLGWSRLALRRATDRIVEIIGTEPVLTPIEPIDQSFEEEFRTQINSIW